MPDDLLADLESTVSVRGDGSLSTLSSRIEEDRPIEAALRERLNLQDDQLAEKDTAIEGLQRRLTTARGMLERERMARHEAEQRAERAEESLAIGGWK